MLEHQNPDGIRERLYRNFEAKLSSYSGFRIFNFRSGCGLFVFILIGRML
jgi:hypothetical protein